MPYGKLVIDRPVAVRETLKGIFLLQLHGEHNCCIEHFSTKKKLLHRALIKEQCTISLFSLLDR